MSETEIENMIGRHVKKSRGSQTWILIFAMAGTGGLTRVIPSISTAEVTTAAANSLAVVAEQIRSLTREVHQTTAAAARIETGLAVMGSTVKVQADTLKDHEVRLRSLQEIVAKDK